MAIIKIFLKICLFLFLFISITYSISSIELRVNRIYEGNINQEIFILECFDTNNNKLNIISFKDYLNDKYDLQLTENSFVNICIKILPEEFIFDIIIPSLIPTYNTRRSYPYHTQIRIDGEVYFNSEDIFYFSNCIKGLSYIEDCNDSTNLKKILELGYIIDKNDNLVKKVDNTEIEKKNKTFRINIDTLIKNNKSPYNIDSFMKRTMEINEKFNDSIKSK